MPNTLDCGQAFCWRLVPGADRHVGPWDGWIAGRRARCWREGPEASGHLVVEPSEPGLTELAVREFFGLDDDLSAMFATFPDDPWIRAARDHSRGMRLLRQPAWDCVVGFLCSAMKQIPQICAINWTIRESFGGRMPTPSELAAAGEPFLRRDAKLGFRAKHLARAAAQIAAGEVDLEHIRSMTDLTARTELMKLAGVGPKIADCVLLFGFTRWRAFPLDVWMLRGLQTLYFPRRRAVKPAELAAFAEGYFGPFGGFAQQQLFHWLRSHGRGGLPDAGDLETIRGFCSEPNGTRK